MSKFQLIADFPRRNITTLIIFLFFLPLQFVVPDIEQTALRYIATQLLPNECQSIINHKVERSPNKLPSNGIDCFRKLVGWTSNLRINRRDAHLVLGNRLHEIGRDDLAAWLVGPAPRKKPVAKQTIEYQSWKSGKKNNAKMNHLSQSNPTISEMDKLIFGSAPVIRPIAGSPPNFGQRSVAFVPEIRNLNGIHTLQDSFKDHSLVMVDPDSNRLATPAPDGVTVVTTVQNQQSEEHAESSTVKANDDKDKKDSQGSKNTDAKSNRTSSAKTIEEDKKHSNKSKFSHFFPHFTDDKNAPCLRVPLGTALVVLGTIMTLACCCALLLRNRIAACFDRLRGKKNKGKPSKRVSADEEQGFMGPRTFGKPPVRSGRKGGGSVDVTNVGIQNSNTANAANGFKELDERSIGCCNCCTRKKRKNKKKRKR